MTDFYADIEVRVIEQTLAQERRDGVSAALCALYGFQSLRDINLALRKDYPVNSRVRQEVREGKANIRSMRSRMNSGMSLEMALDEQRTRVMVRGETLEGYVRYFNPQGITDYARVREWHAADTAFLNALVRAALLKHSGAGIGDVDTFLKNRSFFEQIRTHEQFVMASSMTKRKGVTK